MPERRRKFKLIYLIIIVVIYAAALIALGTMKDAMVISSGIRVYRSLRNTVRYVGGIVVLIAVILFVYDLICQIRWRKKQDEAQAKSRADEEERIYNVQKEQETLSVSRSMDSLKLRKILEEYSGGEWKYLAGELQQLHIQLDMMDEQQEKLAHLLRNNGADALSNTEDILDKVEQHMCRSVRKVINYMDVANADRPDEVRKVQEQLYECHSDNQTQLQQVQEFLFALADFLNTQGDDDSSTQMLELYKNTILDSIND